MSDILGSNARAESKLLIARHGSLARLFAAVNSTDDAYCDAAPLVISRLHHVGQAALASLRAGLSSNRPIYGPDDLIDQLQFDMATLEVETFRLLSLDTANHVIANHEMWRGTVNQVQAYPREIVRQALWDNASALIVAHNHPSGDTNPSPLDLRLTSQIAAAANTMEIALHDHIIVGRLGSTSLRRSHPNLFEAAAGAAGLAPNSSPGRIT